jgi:catalase
MFYRSLSPIEQLHIVEAFTFELGKCYHQEIKERELKVLADVDAGLCAAVAAGLGLPAPSGTPVGEVTPSPMLSQLATVPGPIAGRKVGVVADAGADLAGVASLAKALLKKGARALVIAPSGGVLKAGRRAVTVDRTFLTARSIEFDAVVVAAGVDPQHAGDIKSVILLQEAYRHSKPVGAWGDPAALLGAGIPLDGPGVITGDDPGSTFLTELVALLGKHRVWDRAPAVMASAVPPAKAPAKPRVRAKVS